ncbi:hypothetical protein QCA50_016531 [Cerrena zonata]|uniref:NAD(P)-binding domain-containing protein n=1 Tax=Cerrena zonata TaxID=2478898 RepID=A0AAW0FHQ6_9APHY
MFSSLRDQNDEDKKISERSQTHLATYYKWKYQADKNLIERTAFKWTILRPSGLTNAEGTGKASIGRPHLVPTISRNDVAQTLALLVDRPDAAGLALDIVSSDTPLEEALDEAITKRATAWVG